MQFDLNLNTPYSFIFFVIMLLFVGFAYFIYRHTTPPIPKKMRIFLFILRAIALCLVIFMITEPILSFTKTNKENPIIALLIDNSASMGLKDKESPITRFAYAKEIFAGDENLPEAIGKNAVVQPYTFSKNITQLNVDIDELEPVGGSTNMGDALVSVSQELGEKNFSGAILITDGENNSGRDPLRAAQNLGVPVYTIGIGDPTEPKDVGITKFLTNEIAYVNNKIPIEVTIQSNGFSGNEETTISLREENQTLDSKNIRLTDTFQEHKAILHFTPTTEGLHKYTLTIPVQENEKITQNNSRIFFVNVLKSKMKILYIQGAPSWDYSFIRESLTRDQNVELTSMAMVKKGEFYEQTSENKNKRPAFLPNTTREWNEYDLVILGNISLRDLNSNQEKMLAEFVNDKGKALLFLGGDLAFNPLEYRNSPLNELLPTKLSGGTIDQPFQIKLTPSGRQSALMMVDENLTTNDKIWHEFPPILQANRLGEGKPNAAVLAIHPIEKTPIISTMTINKGKTMSVGFSSFWRWYFLMEGIGKSSGYFDRFMSNIVRWLVTREIDKQVKISTDQVIYRSGQEIFFTSQVYNRNYEPIDDATVEVTITKPGAPDFAPMNISLLPTPTGEGTYASNLGTLPPGDYQFSGEAKSDGRSIGKDSGKFTVGVYSLEYENTKLNEKILKEIAARSDGKYFYHEDWRELPKEIKPEGRIITRKRETPLWDNAWIFIAIVALLGIEWTIRKRRGLA